jgi:hypothetical protein
MDAVILVEFQVLLNQFHKNNVPTTKEELAKQLAQLAELLALCEKILLYAATHQHISDELVTYLFEYKQLLKLQNHLRGLEYSLPHTTTAQTPPEIKKNWKFWQHTPH